MMDNLYQMKQVEEYMYADVQPIIPNIDLERLKQIEGKIKAYTSGSNINSGLNREELEMFLNWVILNARSYAVRNTPLSRNEAIITESMTGQCAPTQNINVKLLRKLGLDIRPFNTGDCIDSTNIPMSNEDLQRINNGWHSTAVRHSVSVVTLPILMQSGQVQEYDFLLDPTFRQFCLKENNQESVFYNTERLSKGYVAPHPAYFMQEDLCKEIISKGYFWLNSQTAKLYGDAFKHASVRKEYQNYIQDTSGEEYINYFKNIPMRLSEDKKGEEQFAKLPSEIEEPKKGITSRIKELFSKIFGRKKQNKMLPTYIEHKNNINKRLTIAALTPEEEEMFRSGETQVLNGNNYINQENIKEEGRGER